MRKLFFLPISLVLLASCSRLHAPVALVDQQLSPEDFGATKYTLRARAMAGEVVVFREEDYWDGKLTLRNDMVSNKRYSDYVQSIVFIDKSILSGTMNSGYILRTPGGPAGDAHFDNARWTGSSCISSPPKVELAIKYNSGNRFYPNRELKIVYTIFVESYQTAKARIPGLSDDNFPVGSWTYSDVKTFDPDTGAEKH